MSTCEQSHRPHCGSAGKCHTRSLRFSASNWCFSCSGSWATGTSHGSWRRSAAQSLVVSIPHITRQTENAPAPEEVAVDPVPPVTIIGEPHEVVAYAGAPNIRLQGRTRARFDGGRSRTENLVTEPGSGCKRCRGKNCVHMTGTVVTEYHVSTTVTLPKASSFRRLTECQRQRVQDAHQ